MASEELNDAQRAECAPIVPRVECAPIVPRVECARCGRPGVACYCAHLSRLATRTRVVVLQHPRERDKAIGTARIAALCLPSAEVFVGVDFSAHARVAALLDDPARPAVLLYPGSGARELAREPPAGPVNLVVVDGTWHQARALLRANPRLRQLPRYAFAPPGPSEYRIRREPRPDYVSTLEALAIALSALEADGRDFAALLAPFRAMVSVQLEFAARSAGGRVRQRRRRPEQARSARARLPGLLLDPGLVCVGAEANAWPYDRARRGRPHPHELVQWLALRLHAGHAFEALLAPRLPLARSPLFHARLDADELRAGLSLAEFLGAWRAFQQPGDVVCSWGSYAASLFEREGVVLPSPMVDLRKVAGDYLQRGPGSLEELVRELELPFTARGRGRGGERLGMLEAAAHFFVREARGS